MAVAETQAGPPRQPRGRWQQFRKRLKDSRTAWLYILPAGLVMLFITLIPQLSNTTRFLPSHIIKRLHSKDGASRRPKWYGNSIRRCPK